MKKKNIKITIIINLNKNKNYKKKNNKKKTKNLKLMCILIPSPIFRWLLGVVDECRIDPLNVEISLPKLVKMAVI